MPHFLAIVPLAFLAACAGAPEPQSPGPRALRYSIEIDGDPSFVKQVSHALRLLKRKSPDSLELVEANVGRIRHAARSGMEARRNPPRISLSSKSAHYSVTWCAGSIVHEAYHSKLYQTHLAAFGPPVPSHVWGGTEVERKAIKRQIKALAEIGAPGNEIAYLFSLDGTHWDVDKDGVYTQNDFLLRDW